jgi:hypothetical protein
MATPLAHRGGKKNNVATNENATDVSQIPGTKRAEIQPLNVGSEYRKLHPLRR